MREALKGITTPLDEKQIHWGRLPASVISFLTQSAAGHVLLTSVQEKYEKLTTLIAQIARSGFKFEPLHPLVSGALHVRLPCLQLKRNISIGRNCLHLYF